MNLTEGESARHGEAGLMGNEGSDNVIRTEGGVRRRALGR